MPKYDAAYFIDKFEKIPEEMWCLYKLYDPETGRCCAMGHCGLRDSTMEMLPEAYALEMLLKDGQRNVYAINNGDNDIVCPQPTARLRILAACRLLKEQGH